MNSRSNRPRAPRRRQPRRSLAFERSLPPAVLEVMLAHRQRLVSALAKAMGVDPSTDDVMARKPRRLSERAIDARMWAGVIQIGLVMAVVTLLTIDLYLPGGLIEGTHDLATARTAGFAVLVFAQLFNCLAK